MTYSIIDKYLPEFIQFTGTKFNIQTNSLRNKGIYKIYIHSEIYDPFTKTVVSNDKFYWTLVVSPEKEKEINTPPFFEIALI